jgi:hypothetical protein
MVVQLNKIHENDFTISEIEFETFLKYFPHLLLFLTLLSLFYLNTSNKIVIVSILLL